MTRNPLDGQEQETSVMTTTTETTGPIDPRTGRVDLVKRFRQWVDAGRPGLEVDETAVCATGVKLAEDDERIEDADENGWIECGKVSRFIVERSDFAASYGELGGGCEACEEHVAEEMFLMLEGDDTIRAVVTPRWDTGSEEPRAL